MERERDVSGQLPPGFRVNSTPVAATAAANVNTGAVDIGATAAAVVAPAVGEWYETWTAFPIEVVPFIQTRQGHKKIDLVRPSARIYSGARNIPPGTTSPGDYMSLLCTDAMLQTFCDSTNSFVKVLSDITKAGYAWTDDKPLIVVELKCYFGLLTYMGIHRLPQQRMYWSRTMYSSEFVRNAMPRKRFLAIQAFLHWTDTSGLSEQERATRNRVDGFWTVASYLDQLSDHYQYYYECYRFISIDEMCIFFKGRHRCKNYNPNKPNKWHLKAFCLNDAKTGYLSCFFMYRGKDQERPADIPATVFPVIKLTANAMYHNKGYVLGTDNWYTQLMVLLKMMDIGIDIVGTVKANKKGLPKECMFPKKGRNVRLRGEMRSMTVAMPLRAGGTVPIYFTAWMDSKPVHMLSTFAPYQAECLRNRATAAGGHEKAPCPQPLNQQ